MKILTLVRHAKSSWKDPELADFDRPLNARGKRDAPLMGRRLAARGERPDLILCSPARRAVTTMKKIAFETKYPEKGIMLDSRIYEADASRLLEIVKGIDDGYDTVMICGHNPGLTDFCNIVANCRIENIPTCGLVSLSFLYDSWTEVAPHSGEVLYFDYPKKTEGTDG